MEKAVELLGNLVLTFLGFVVPIVGVLLSIFQEGISKLATQYENEKAQSESNIKEQIKALGEAATTDTTKIEESLKELKVIKKTAEAKLSYLTPKKQILRLSIPLLISYSGVMLALLYHGDDYSTRMFTLLSFVCLSYAIGILWKSLTLMAEVKKTIDTEQRDERRKTNDLLSTLVEKVEKGGQSFLENVYVTLEGRNIKDDGLDLDMEANRKRELRISLTNLEKRMAKNLEIGFIFPSDFIIEKNDYYSIYTTEKTQIVRYALGLVHGDTNQILSPLVITPLKKGDWKVRTFIKAENIEATYRDLNIKIA